MFALSLTKGILQIKLPSTHCNGVIPDLFAVMDTRMPQQTPGLVIICFGESSHGM